jgi:hypothetical protein
MSSHKATAFPMLLGVLLLWQTAAPAAQLAYLWSFDELRTKSDLVVIAAWVNTVDTGIRTANADLKPPLPVIIMNTQFKILSVVKGTLKTGDTFVLRHYRLDTDRMPAGVINGGGSLRLPPPPPVTLVPAPLDAYPPEAYLLFLKRDVDGTFVPTSGQVWPDDSVFALRNSR